MIEPNITISKQIANNTNVIVSYAYDDASNTFFGFSVSVDYSEYMERMATAIETIANNSTKILIATETIANNSTKISNETEIIANNSTSIRNSLERLQSVVDDITVEETNENGEIVKFSSGPHLRNISTGWYTENTSSNENIARGMMVLNLKATDTLDDLRQEIRNPTPL